MMVPSRHDLSLNGNLPQESLRQYRKISKTGRHDSNVHHRSDQARKMKTFMTGQGNGMEHGDWDRLSEEGLVSLVQLKTLPRHVAIIMDGNGRWAMGRGLPRVAGHREGVLSVREAIKVCRELGISALTLYAFSLENWKRPPKEIALLMDLFCEYFQSECEYFLREQIRFHAIGRLALLPQPIQTMISELQEQSKGYDQLTVTLALSYGARSEIVDAIKRLLHDVPRDPGSEGMISEEMFAQYLDTWNLPDPDLLIRTSGESRVSNFLLWQIAYAELYFTRTLWPDFRRRDLLLALLDYQRRERRLGGLDGTIDSLPPSFPQSSYFSVFHKERRHETTVPHISKAGVPPQNLPRPLSLASWLD